MLTKQKQKKKQFFFVAIFSATNIRLWDLPKTKQDAILFFQEGNILPKKRKCTNSHNIKLYLGKRTFWNCYFIWNLIHQSSYGDMIVLNL